MEPPGPIPNPEVKRCSADGSETIGLVRVGRRQVYARLQAIGAGLFFCPADQDLTENGSGRLQRGTDMAQNSQLPGVRAKGMTSRMFAIPVTNINIRSKPSPKPAWGTLPNLRRSEYQP